MKVHRHRTACASPGQTREWRITADMADDYEMAVQLGMSHQGAAKSFLVVLFKVMRGLRLKCGNNETAQEAFCLWVENERKTKWMSPDYEPAILESEYVHDLDFHDD